MAPGIVEKYSRLGFPIRRTGYVPSFLPHTVVIRDLPSRLPARPGSFPNYNYINSSAVRIHLVADVLALAVAVEPQEEKVGLGLDQAQVKIKRSTGLQEAISARSHGRNRV